MPGAHTSTDKSKGKNKATGDAFDPAEPHIPRPMNMFMIFRAEKINWAHDQGIKGDALKEFTATISDTWRKIDSNERERYAALAEEQKEEHRKKYPGYKYKPRTQKQKEIEHAYKQAKRKAEIEEKKEQRQKAKDDAKKGRYSSRRQPSADSDIVEIKKEDVSPKPNRTRSTSRRKSSTAPNPHPPFHHLSYYSHSSWGPQGPPPEYIAVAAATNGTKSSDVVYQPTQPMYAPLPSFNDYRFDNATPNPGAFPQQIAIPAAEGPLTDHALAELNSHGREYDASSPAHVVPPPPNHEVDGASEGRTPSEDGQTPESGQFSEPVVYKDLWLNLRQGVDSSLAAPQENFDDLLRLPGDEKSPPPQQKQRVASDYTNWKRGLSPGAASTSSITAGSVHIKIAKGIATDGGQASNQLADQMIAQMSMANNQNFGSVQVQQQQQQLTTLNPTAGDLGLAVSFDPQTVLTFSGLPDFGGMQAQNGLGFTIDPASAVWANPPTIWDPNAPGAQGYSQLWNVMSDPNVAFNSFIDFSGCGGATPTPQNFDRAFWEETLAAVSGPTPPPGSNEEQLINFFNSMKTETPDMLAETLTMNGFDAEAIMGEHHPKAKMDEDLVDRSFDSMMSFGADLGPAEAPEDLPESVIYHHSPPRGLSPSTPTEDVYVPPSGASKFAGRRVAGKWNPPKDGETVVDEETPRPLRRLDTSRGSPIKPLAATRSHGETTATAVSAASSPVSALQYGFQLAPPPAFPAQMYPQIIGPSHFAASYPAAMSVPVLPSNMRGRGCQDAEMGPPPPVRTQSKPIMVAGGGSAGGR